MASNAVRVSIIVPVHNTPRDLSDCLSALKAAAGVESEIIVVEARPRTIRLPSRLSKAYAFSSLQRTRALERHETTEYSLTRRDRLLVDSDVAVAPDAVRRVTQAFANDPEVEPSSVPTTPSPAKGLVSQYRNLLHHFVHQHGNPDASTFWGGCGAVRRSVFEAVGGFDEKFRPVCSVDDIELGYRILRAGHRIFLDKALQGTH